MNKKLFFALPVLILTVMACSLTPVVNTAVPQATADNSQILFQDDFSDVNSGWDRSHNDDYSTDYELSGYRIVVVPETYSAFGNPYKTFQNDVSIEVDATKNGGSDDNAFGLICRYQDIDNFYYFYISSDGYVGIGMNNAGTKTIISSSDGNMVSAAGINPGAATNHMQVDCIGNSLTLFVNGSKIASATDGTFTGGDIGLIARTFGVGGTDMVFDNLVVRKP